MYSRCGGGYWYFIIAWYKLNFQQFENAQLINNSTQQPGVAHFHVFLRIYYYIHLLLLNGNAMWIATDVGNPSFYESRV